jgi:hypothetical protein
MELLKLNCHVSVLKGIVFERLQMDLWGVLDSTASEEISSWRLCECTEGPSGFEKGRMFVLEC